MFDSSRRNSTNSTPLAPIGAHGDTPLGTDDASLPLVRRFPALAAVPRVRLGIFPSPITSIDGLDVQGELWVKRDDLNAPAFGGNKLRALEFLLADVQPSDTVIALGGEGSTHVLTAAALGAMLGARTVAIRWRHEMNPVARVVAQRARELCAEVYTTPGVLSALLLAHYVRRRSGARLLPLGGTSPLGMLGHVNAGLELAEQVARGALPAPAEVVVPVGSGGTAAGLALGFALAGLDAMVVAARVAPRMAANRRRVMALIRSCARFIERLAGGRARELSDAARASAARVRIVHDVYGGGYGRALPAARNGAPGSRLDSATGIQLDDTYSAKAFIAALAEARQGAGRTLFWMTFDGRSIGRTEGLERRALR